MVNDSLKIGKRYIAKEIEQLLFALQGNTLKVGALEELLSAYLKRTQIKYLLEKLKEDNIVKVEGKIKGVRYSIADKYADLRGDVLINEVMAELRRKHEQDHSL